MCPSHPFETRVLDFIRSAHLITPASHLACAVSGGPDSVALLHALRALRTNLDIERLTVVHFDHRLRGEDSRADASFVAGLADRLGLPFLCGSEDVRRFGQQHGLSLEMAARACRHHFFDDVLERHGATTLALGHTASDQAEELLLRLLRGTGPSGLAGMRPRTANGRIRPLLFAQRPEILGYLHDRGLDFREDASNREPFCQRNALRLEVLPLLEKHFHGRIIDTLTRHSGLVQEEESWWETQLDALWPTVCLKADAPRLLLDLGQLRSLHPALLKRLIRRAVERLRGNALGIYAVHLEAAARWIAKGRSGTGIDLPGGLRLTREGAALVLAELGLSPSPPPGSDPIDRPGRYRFAAFGLTLSLEEAPSGLAAVSSTDQVQLDADRIRWPLFLRTWQPGDRFQPLGMDGSKKLQDYFTDSRVPKSRRHTVPLLCDQEKICWIVGFRLDGRLKLTAQTRKVLTLRVEFDRPAEP